MEGAKNSFKFFCDFPIRKPKQHEKQKSFKRKKKTP